MSFTQDEYKVVGSSSNKTVELEETVILEVNTNNPFAQQDYALIIKAFELEASDSMLTEDIKAHHYRDVYSTRNFSERVRQQMNYYPGMHQTNNTSSIPAEDPFYSNAAGKAAGRLDFWDNAMDSPDSFMDGLRDNQADFDYAEIFGPNVAAEDRAKEIGKMITECVPCFGRLLDGMQLLPDGDLLEVHALNIKLRTNLLSKTKDLFRDPGSFVDICDLLKLFSKMCPADLLAMISLLTQYLAKLNLDFRFNLDFVIQLVGPLLSPFLDALSSWLDKWIQLILGPMTCVVDHINETILLSQSLKIPFSDVSANVEMDLGIAAPAHKNAAGAFGSGAGASSDGSAGAWTGWQWEEFNTPDEQKYNPEVPSPPSEETQLAIEEMKTGWSSEGISEAEAIERDARWQEIQDRERAKRVNIPPPEQVQLSNGTRWSKDDIPESEKISDGDTWEASYYPPEKQRKPSQGTEYFDPHALVNSIVQVRNILQGSIQYVKDWFTYITQMIYDLLGTDFGWMTKKIDNTKLKSRVLEIIMLIKSILSAVTKNGLECGTHSNFDQGQLKYVLEEELNRFSSATFSVADDGTITMIPPGKKAIPELKDLTDKLDEEVKDDIPGTTPGSTVKEPSSEEQKAVDSGIIIKDCFRNVTREELSQVREWIADFEKRGSI